VKRYVIAALLLASCGSAAAKQPEGPLSGVVSRTEYDDPDRWTETYQCGTNKIGNVNVPIMCNRTRHDGPHWYVAVATDADKVRVVEVGQDVHDGCRIGARFIEGRCAS
jgi:hypothetical protein